MFVISTEYRARSVPTRGCWLSEGDCNSVFIKQFSFFPKPIAIVLIVKPHTRACLEKAVPKKPGLVVRGPSSSGDTMPVVASGASSSSATTLVVGPQQPKAPQQALACAPVTGALFLGATATASSASCTRGCGEATTWSAQRASTQEAASHAIGGARTSGRPAG